MVATFLVNHMFKAETNVGAEKNNSDDDIETKLRLLFWVTSKPLIREGQCTSKEATLVKDLRSLTAEDKCGKCIEV